MSHKQLEQWLLHHPLQPAEVDCVTAVMLKILDGKCKMNADEKRLMRALYRAVRQQPGMLLGEDIHLLIESFPDNPDEARALEVYEQRVLAETRISRPVMKAFKARIRDAGLFVLQTESELIL